MVFFDKGTLVQRSTVQVFANHLLQWRWALPRMSCAAVLLCMLPSDCILALIKISKLYM